MNLNWPIQIKEDCLSLIHTQKVDHVNKVSNLESISYIQEFDFDDIYLYFRET